MRGSDLAALHQSILIAFRRLSFQSCTYGSVQARERWKYESSFEHLVGESKSSQEPNYDPRLVGVTASKWQVTCLNDAQFRALIHWYLSWDHPSNPLFNEDDFLNALRSGPNESCTVVLVHMVLAYASVRFARFSPFE